MHFHLFARIDPVVSLSVWMFFVHPEFNRSQVRSISLWLAVCSKIQEHNIFIQGKLFFFNTNIHSTSTQTIFFSTQIFIQLQLKLFSFNQKISIEVLYLNFPETPNVYSTNTTRPKFGERLTHRPSFDRCFFRLY